MVWVKPFQPIMTRWLKNRNSNSRLCERCVFLSTCKWCTRCVCLFLKTLEEHQIQADSMTMAGEEEGTREVRFEHCEHFFYFWDLFRCAPPRTLFSSISQSQRPTMVEQLGFSFLGNMTRYWQHALYKFNFIRSLIIDVSLGGTLPQDHKNLFPGHPWHQASPRLRPSFPTKRNASRWTW